MSNNGPKVRLPIGVIVVLSVVSSGCSSERATDADGRRVDLASYATVEFLENLRSGTIDSLGGQTQPFDATDRSTAAQVADQFLERSRGGLAREWTNDIGRPVAPHRLQVCHPPLRVESPWAADTSSEVLRVETSDALVFRVCDGAADPVGLISVRTLVPFIGPSGLLRDDPPPNSINWSAWRPTWHPEGQIPDFSDAIQRVAQVSKRRVSGTPKLMASPGSVRFLGNWWFPTDSAATLRSRVSGSRVVTSLIGWGSGGFEASGLQATVSGGPTKSVDSIRTFEGQLILLRRKVPYNGQIVEVMQ